MKVTAWQQLPVNIIGSCFVYHLYPELHGFRFQIIVNTDDIRKLNDISKCLLVIVEHRSIVCITHTHYGIGYLCFIAVECILQ